MEPTEYHYVYYSFEEYDRGYIGSRSCKCLPEEDVKYFGSFKDKNFKPTQKIILKDDYATREDAYADEITLQQYYHVVENPHFANRAYQTSTKFYLPKEQAIENGRNNKKNGKGIFAQTFEERSEIAKRNSRKNKENKVGIFALTKEELSENGKKGGKISGQKCKKLGIGIFSMDEEERAEANKIGGKKIKELGIGIFGMSQEERKETVAKTNSQKWMCLDTGYVTNSGALTRYQKARGIDTSKRRRLS